jgi:N-acetylglutamate synthase-like GNAT family acetyltransferase
MKIIKYDSDARFTEIINIFEASRQKYTPKAPIMDEEDAKIMIKTHYPNTVFERDVLCAVTDEGKTIGMVGLYKKDNDDKWFPLMDVLPEYETVELWNEMITAILNLAKEQNAPELHFQASKLRTTLTQALAMRNITPDHYIYSLHLKNFKDIPEVSIPTGITIEKTSTIRGKNQYISVMNEAYKDADEWTPDTEENLMEAEIMNKKQNFETIYYLAYEGKKLVGACNVMDHPKDSSNRFIAGLGVQTEYEKKGIGGALMYAALSDMKTKGRKDVKFNTFGKDTSAIKLPVKFGFKEIPDETTMVFSIKP